MRNLLACWMIKDGELLSETVFQRLQAAAPAEAHDTGLAVVITPQWLFSFADRVDAHQQSGRANRCLSTTNS